MKSDIYKVLDVDTGEEYILHDKDLHEQSDRQSADTSAAVSMVEQETERAKQAEQKIRDDFFRSVDEARTYANDAKASSQSAKESADTASGSAADASASANSAASSATQAASYAEGTEYRLMLDSNSGRIALAHFAKET